MSLKIYLVIPDASALLVRRLKGGGFAFGASVTIAESMHELPANPPDGAILVVPEHLKVKPPDNVCLCWSKIFVIDTEQSSDGVGTGRVITSSMNNPNSTWPKILQGIFECKKATFQASTWHSTRLREQTPVADLHGKLAHWAKQHKVKSYASVGSIFKTIEQLPNKLGPSIVDFEISLDATSLRLTLSTTKHDSATRQAFIDLSANPYAHLSFVRHEKDSIIASLKVDFGAQGTPRVCLIENEDPAGDNDAVPVQEAS